MTPSKGIVATLLATCCLLAAASPSAMGATAKSVSGTGDCSKFSMCPYGVEFTAAAGETNVVTITHVAGSNPPVGPEDLVIRDEGAPIVGDAGCTRIDNASVYCRAPAFLTIETGDMNDSVVSDGGSVSGGSGDDRLVGGPDGDFLAGEAGADTLVGGGGDDSLKGDNGNDQASVDILDGGDGNDNASYAGRRAPVSLTIGADDTEDKLTSIESATGGGGNDVIVGDAGDNTLKGGPGNDRLRGAGGADELDGDKGDDRVDGDAGNDVLSDQEGANRLYGGPGEDELEGGVRRDRLVGGPGNDALDLGGQPFPIEESDRVPDSITCGPGHDGVTNTDPSDLVPVDCERVLIDYYEVVGRPRRVARSAVRVRCHFLRDLYEGARARVWLFMGGRRLGRSRPVRRSGTLTVRLNSAGRRVVKAGAIVVIRPRVGSSEHDGFAVKLR